MTNIHEEELVIGARQASIGDASHCLLPTACCNGLDQHLAHPMCNKGILRFRRGVRLVFHARQKMFDDIVKPTLSQGGLPIVSFFFGLLVIVLVEEADEVFDDVLVARHHELNYLFRHAAVAIHHSNGGDGRPGGW